MRGAGGRMRLQPGSDARAHYIDSLLDRCLYGGIVAKLKMTPALLELVADRFKVLAESARLEILNHLRNGEMTVGDLVETTGMGQANVSKHLRLLHENRFVERRKEGLFVYYSLADESVFTLCEMMCGRLEAEMKTRRKLFAS